MNELRAGSVHVEFAPKSQRSPRFIMRIRPLLALLSLTATVLWAGCGDETCTLQCATRLECGFTNAGDEACLETCGNDLCQDNETCESNQCVVSGNVSCGAGEHAVSGNCVPNYTSTNACDPLFSCRRSCGPSPGCLAACDADASSACTSLINALTTCQTRNNCGSLTYDANCCADEFCNASVSNPNCGNVPACDACAEEANGNATVFNNCRADEPACNACLDPFLTCQESGGNCDALFCDCVSPENCN
jgi:hypothetical protein